MPPPDQLNVALKEWHTVCRALASGRQTILLRKGGISESMSGFDVEHRQFLFFPTFVHQQLPMLKPEAQVGFAPHASEPLTIAIELAAEIVDIIQLKHRAQMDALESEHIWTPPLIDMRFNYRPQSPLYLLIVRTYRLAKPVTLQNAPAYAGCKSWVPLKQAVECADATPAIADDTFAKRADSIRRALG
ncbi:MAG: DUF1802 family protein [Anaerolineae bacterium]|nr:DUF1802 family protein [Phycisphaerae bacterium]